MINTLVLISGKARSGKSTLASYLENSFHGQGKKVGIENISSQMKYMASKDFKKLSDYLNEFADCVDSFTDVPDIKYNDYLIKLKEYVNNIRISNDKWYENKTKLSRILLQIYGTEIFQNRVDVNYWVNLLKNKIQVSDKNIIIIPDVRFESNIDSLSDGKFKAYTIRVVRNDIPVINHPTETALDKYKFWNYIVENNNGLDELKKSASKIVSDITSCE